MFKLYSKFSEPAHHQIQLDDYLPVKGKETDQLNKDLTSYFTQELF
jgi:hypothetical protein